MSNLSTIIESNSLRQILQFFPFVITVFSALRLAKFNIDTRQSTSFIGLPTPANTLLVVSFPLMLKQDLNAFGPIILNRTSFIVFRYLFLSAGFGLPLFL